MTKSKGVILQNISTIKVDIPSLGEDLYPGECLKMKSPKFETLQEIFRKEINIKRVFFEEYQPDENSFYDELT